MALKQYLKRTLNYILHGVPVRKVYANVTVLSPSEYLKGRTALITGGTSGIGYEIAKAFLYAGAEVVITGRNTSKLEDARHKLMQETGKNVCATVWDVTNIKGIAKKATEIQNLVSSPIDILVNNAGLVGGEIKNCTEETYDTIMNTNLKGTFFLSQHIAHTWVDKGIRGNILNIGSSSSLRPATSAYTLTKNALLGFTRGLAKVLAPHGITVNGLAPGPTATLMTMPDGVKDEISFRNPLGRYVLPQEIANMAVFLVSEMGRSIIGDMVFMTGGSGITTLDDVNYSF